MAKHMKESFYIECQIEGCKKEVVYRTILLYNNKFNTVHCCFLHYREILQYEKFMRELYND